MRVADRAEHLPLHGPIWSSRSPDRRFAPDRETERRLRDLVAGLGSQPTQIPSIRGALQRTNEQERTPSVEREAPSIPDRRNPAPDSPDRRRQSAPTKAAHQGPRTPLSDRARRLGRTEAQAARRSRRRRWSDAKPPRNRVGRPCPSLPEPASTDPSAGTRRAGRTKWRNRSDCEAGPGKSRNHANRNSQAYRSA